MYGTKVIDILDRYNIAQYHRDAIDFIKTPVIYGPLNYKNISYMKLLYFMKRVHPVSKHLENKHPV